MSLTLITGGSFVSTGVTQTILLPGGADYFRVINVTQAATTQATGRGVQFEWFADSTAVGNALMLSKTNSTNASNLSLITSGGFTYSPTGSIQYAPITGTTISQAGSAVASATNTFSNGDRVRVYGVVGMRQISGMFFTVSSVSGSAFTLAGLDSSGFAAAGTAFNAVKIPPYEAVLPEYLFITNISQASQAVLKVSTTHQYVAGMNITVYVPAGYGMTEMNGLTMTIASVGAYTITVDVDSSGFTAWTWPTSSASVNLDRFATIAPAGQRAYYNLVTSVQYGYNVNQAPFQSSTQSPYMLLPAGASSPAGSTGDTVQWMSYRYGGGQ